MSSSVYEITVSDIMSGHPVTLDAGATVHDALTVMAENKVSSVPIIDNREQCVGILSTADLMEMARDVDGDVGQLDSADLGAQRDVLDKLSHSVGQEPIQSYMSESVDTIAQTATLAEAAREMVQYNIHHLPVVNNDNKLVGIVSTMDLLKAFADSAP